MNAKLSTAVLMSAALLAGCASPAMPTEGEAAYAVDYATVEHAPNPRFAGIETAVLHGDPRTGGLTAVSIRTAAGTSVPPHTHPYDVTTVVTSGTVHVGVGNTFDDAKLVAYPEGSIFVTPAGVPHFMRADSGDNAIIDHYEGPLVMTPADADAPVDGDIQLLDLEQIEHPPAPIPGVTSAVLLGSRESDDLYATHARVTAGSRIPPHVHRNTLTTVVTYGTAYVGYGKVADDAQLVAYPAGTFFTTPAEVPHFIVAKDGDFGVLDHGVGPSDFRLAHAEDHGE